MPLDSWLAHGSQRLPVGTDHVAYAADFGIAVDVADRRLLLAEAVFEGFDGVAK